MSGILAALAGIKTAIATAVDEYFNRVTLLLPGDGTNGAQNNTFLDSSTNNFTITRNGNTTQGTFSPFSQTGWSIYSAGTGYLQAGSNAALAPGSGNFTVECWVYPIGNSSYMGIYQNYTDGLSRSTALRISINTTDNTSLIVQTQASAIITAPTGSMTANAWNHIALVRNGSGTNNLVLYVNGVSKGTATNTTNFSDGFAQVGNTVYNAANYYWNGYISNFRIVPGTAVYPGAFSPPTAPLTPISGTALLTCQSNRFVDNGTANAGSGFALTVSGTPSVQAFSPFAPTAAYSAATNGGSGYFDGTGDYLTVADNAAFQPGSGNFTFEAWVYPISFPSSGNYKALWAHRTNSSTFAGAFLAIGGTSKNFEYFIANSTATSWQNTNYNSGLPVTLNAWQHVALIRNGNVVTPYKNGVAGTAFTVATGAIGTSSNFSIMAGTADGAQTTDGYLSNFRMVKGQALATGEFTPPTAPVTTSSVGWTGANAASSITGTVGLLTNFTNAGITDATAKNDLETVGNAQISTTQSKFGGSSMYFDGTGDYLIMKENQLQAFGTGDFTIEFWLNTSDLGASSDKALIDFRPSGTNGAYPYIYIYQSKVRYYFQTADRIVQASTLSTGVWYHIAICREGSSTRMFIDGTQTSSTYTNSDSCLVGTNRPVIGANSSLGANFNGYIDDFRITKGLARYVSNFSVPTAPFALQ